MKFLILTLLALFISLCASSESIETMQPQKRVIILLGPPGSGKGTQAKVITATLEIPHISTGDLFRENISKGTPIGKMAKGYIDAGKLVPDEVVIEMLKERVSRPDSINGYLLDGFPRTIAQAEQLEKMLGKEVKVIVINLAVPDEVITKRIEGRLTCQGCGEVYNKYYNPPADLSVCDKCEGSLISRPDDKLEVVQERLRVYHAQTAPLEDFYKKRGLLHSIDGNRDSSLVRQEMMQLLKQP